LKTKKSWKRGRDGEMSAVVGRRRRVGTYCRIRSHWKASMRMPLHQGPSNHRLYPFVFSSNKKLTPSTVVGERVSVSKWHSRLGHPTLKVVCQVLSSFQLPVSSSNQFSPCAVCLGYKSTQLPFPSSSTKIMSPLQLIYIDVWGFAPCILGMGFGIMFTF